MTGAARVLSGLALALAVSACQSPGHRPGPDPAGAGPYVTVLGIAQDAGYPQAGCAKACCQKAWAGAAQRRLATCLALVDPAAGSQWLFEATPDIREQLRVLESHPGTLAGLFLTHAHIGHYTGLMQFGREVMGARRLPVYVMPRMQRFLEENSPWSQLVALENITLVGLRPGAGVDLTGRVRVEPLLVPHRDEFSETVGYRIRGPRRAVLFIPDIDKWERWERSIVAQIKAVDVALLDGTFFADGELPGRDMREIPHPFVEESLALFAGLSDAEKRKVHFIHFNHTNPLLDPNSSAATTVAGHGFRVAREGQVLPL